MNTYLIQNIYRYLIYGVALLTALPFTSSPTPGRRTSWVTRLPATRGG